MTLKWYAEGFGMTKPSKNFELNAIKMFKEVLNGK